MDEMQQFMSLYDELSGSRPIYLSIQHIKTGIERWRIHILEKDGSIYGDKEMVCAEDASRPECFRKATEALKRQEGGGS